MIGSLYTGISGLNANSTAMEVIGDNIANVNTTAFKSNRSLFANVLSTTIGGESITSRVGLGTELWGINAQWTQGPFEESSSATDLGINGSGFFMVQDAGGSNYYTRAGSFRFDREGYLVNPDGLTVQGYAIGADGAVGAITDIHIPGERISSPSATTEFNFDVNLDSGAAAGDTYTTAMTMYDSLGNAIPVTFTFTRQAAAQSWTVTGAIPSTAGTGVTFGGSPGLDIVFDASGAMTTPAGNVTVDLALTNGADALSTTWALTDASGNSYGDLTGYATDSSTTFQYQDGYPAGRLSGVSVDESGLVTASYTSGEKTPLFQVALVDFANYDGLTKMGGNLYAESISSGQPLIGVANTGRLGSVSPSSLEGSNVDLAEEFVKMITTQRAFQANSRVITTSDEILQELISIKR